MELSSIERRWLKDKMKLDSAEAKLSKAKDRLLLAKNGVTKYIAKRRIQRSLSTVILGKNVMNKYDQLFQMVRGACDVETESQLAEAVPSESIEATHMPEDLTSDTSEIPCYTDRSRVLEENSTRS